MPAVTVTDLNNAKLDLDFWADLVTSEADFVVDRLGGTRPTAKYLERNYPNAHADAVSAAADAGVATIAKIAAESARDAAIIGAGVYADEPTGRAAVADGIAFKVQGSGNVAAYEYRRTNAGASVLIATYPSSAAIVSPLGVAVDRAVARIGRPVAYYGPAIAGVTNVSMAGTTYTQTNGASSTHLIEAPLASTTTGALQNFLSVSAGGSFSIGVEVTSGVFVSATAQQYAGSTPIGSAAALSKISNYYVLENQVLDATATKIRVVLRNNSGAASVMYKDPVFVAGAKFVVVSPEDEVGLVWLYRAMEKLQARNLFNLASFATASGTAGSTASGSTLNVVADSLVRAFSTAPANGTVVTAFLKISPDSFGGTTAANHSFGENSSPGLAGAGRFFARIPGTNYYRATLTVGEFVGSQPSQLVITINNRILAGNIAGVNAAIVVSGISVAEGDVAIPPFVSGPAKDFVAANAALTMYVDPAGSDSNDGTSGSPVATIARALALGGKTIRLRKSALPHRHTGIVLTGDVKINSYTLTGYTAQYARLWCSTGVDIPTTPTTVADANVRYYATATNPSTLFENLAGVLTRIGVVAADPGGLKGPHEQPSASEAAVRSATLTTGAWWFGAGSEGTGIYFRPVGGVTTGKLLEVSAAEIGVTMSQGDLTLRGVQLAFGRANALTYSDCKVSATECGFGYNGDNGTGGSVVTLGNSEFYHVRCVFEESGDDGEDTIGPHTKVTGIAAKFNNNIGDGTSQHQPDQDITYIGCEANGNGKEGFAAVGQGNYKLIGCTARGNYSIDMLFLIDDLNTSTVDLQNNTADWCEIACPGAIGTPSTVVGKVSNHRGPMLVKADVAISDHRCVGQMKASHALRVQDGSVTLSDFYYAANTTGIQIEAGTLNATTGQILRNTTGINQIGGALTLAAATPVNVYANTTQFAGVSGPDQAKTVSVAAV